MAFIFATHSYGNRINNHHIVYWQLSSEVSTSTHHQRIVVCRKKCIFIEINTNFNKM